MQFLLQTVAALIVCIHDQHLQQFKQGPCELATLGMGLNCCQRMRRKRARNTCRPLGNPGRPEKLGTRLKPADMRPSAVPPWSSPKRDGPKRWTPGYSPPATAPGRALTVSEPLSTEQAVEMRQTGGLMLRSHQFDR